jgi:hypothetical protein
MSARRRRPPNRRGHRVLATQHNGVDLTIGVGHYVDGLPAEIFIDANKIGSALHTIASDGAVLISLLLQEGCDVDAIRHSLSPTGLLAAVLDRISEESGS